MAALLLQTYFDAPGVRSSHDSDEGDIAGLRPELAELRVRFAAHLDQSHG